MKVEDSWRACSHWESNLRILAWVTSTLTPELWPHALNIQCNHTSLSIVLVQPSTRHMAASFSSAQCCIGPTKQHGRLILLHSVLYWPNQALDTWLPHPPLSVVLAQPSNMPPLSVVLALLWTGRLILLHSRFHHYDCLVVPMDSIADTFPWEKISLLVEYEPLSTPLFPEGSYPNSVRLKQYLILRTVREPSAASLADSGV